MSEKQAINYLFKMFKKYHKNKKVDGIEVLTKESEKWFDSIIIIKKNIK